jgi:hypothetical protein
MKSEVAQAVFWHCEYCGVQGENDCFNRECRMQLEQIMAIGKVMRLNKGRTYVPDDSQ